MRRLVITLLIASFTLALAVASASAGRLSTSDLDIEWHTVIVITSDIATIRCPATLLGNFHGSTIRKTVGSLVGTITHATLAEPCQALDESLPWHLTYESFVGTLPRITTIWFLIIGMSSQFRSEGTACLFSTTITEPTAIGAIIEGSGSSRSITFDPRRTIDTSGGILCDLAGDISLGGLGLFEGGEGDTNVFRLI